MCFGSYHEAGSMEACDNATNTYLHLKYRKRPSWLAKNVHRVKKMMRPVVEMIQKSHRAKELATAEKPSSREHCAWDSGAEELENDANEALESKFPEYGCTAHICCEVRESCRMAPVFIPLAWAADADICLQEGGFVITSSQLAERQTPCFLL